MIFLPKNSTMHQFSRLKYFFSILKLQWQKDVSRNCYIFYVNGLLNKSPILPYGKNIQFGDNTFDFEIVQIVEFDLIMNYSHRISNWC